MFLETKKNLIEQNLLFSVVGKPPKIRTHTVDLRFNRYFQFQSISKIKTPRQKKELSVIDSVPIITKKLKREFFPMFSLVK